ncbi:MAG: RHS repeat-associated core domain-containing protein, partial [Anaerolineae bacterium]|nr:RHS repeat-associated core domain-containing protein [Anaerolineae bacterium]
MRQEGVVYYIHTDHLGSTSLLSDGSGNEIPGSRVSYFPYGETRIGVLPALPTDFAFTGQRNEGTIALYDYHARFYDPVLGRFVSADTIVPNPGNPQDLNRYTYAANNPLKYVDPSGHYDLWSGRDNIWGVPEDPVIATHTHSDG